MGHLATADANGRPHVIPVCFAYDGQHIYSVLDAKPKRGALTGLRRVRNILANPQVSLVIDHYDEDWTRLWYLLVQGRAELVEDGPEPPAAIALLREKYPQYREYASRRQSGDPDHTRARHRLGRRLKRRASP